MAEFYDKLEEGKLDPVYILVSKEPLLLDRAQSAIRDAAVPKDLRSFNMDQLHGKTASADQVLTVAQTLPMMAKKRLLIIRGFDGMAAPELAKLVDYLDSPNPSTVLVGVCAKVDKRIKFFLRAKKLGFLRELSVPRRLGPWIRDEANAKGVHISGAATDRLAEVVGADLARLGLSLDQLALYCMGRQIEVDDVDDLIADTRERSVFELTDAISSKSDYKALAAVASLFEQRQSSIGVVMMLARHMRQVALCQGGMSEGLSSGELVKRVSAPPFVVEKLAREAKNYSVRALAEAMTMLAEADRSLKGFGASSKVLGRTLAEQVIVEQLVTGLIRLATR